MIASERSGLLGENFLAALKYSNPVLASYFEAKKDGQDAKGIAGKQLSVLADVAGVKTAKLSHNQIIDKASEGKTIEERIDSQDAYKAKQKPPSPADKVAMAGAAEQANQDRVVDIVKGLSKPSQDLLDKNELTIPSYQNKVHIRKGEELNLNSKEQAQLKEKLIDGYDEVIRGFSDQDFVGLSKGEKQQMLNRQLHRVSKQAEREVRNSID